MMPHTHATLLDIANAARLVQCLIRGMTQEVFFADLKTHFAVLHRLTAIGRAVKRSSQAFRDQQPSFPWSLMAGMRDHLIHGYDAVDLVVLSARPGWTGDDLAVGCRVHPSPHIALERLVNATAPMPDGQQAGLKNMVVRDGPEGAATRDGVTACRKRGPHAYDNDQL